MTTGELLWVVLVGGSLLALTLAILIKIYGQTRLLLGFAMAIISCFTVLLGWMILADPREAGWRFISLFLASLAALFTSFMQFLRAGQKNDKIDVETAFPSIADTESIDEEDPPVEKDSPVSD